MVSSVSVEQARLLRPKNIPVLDHAPPFVGALSRSKHRKEAAQWHCRITIFHMNEINKIAVV